MQTLAAKVILGTVLAALLAGAGLAYHAWVWLHSPISDQRAQIEVELPPGSSMKSLARKLAQRGVIEQPQVWAFYARFTDQAQSLRAGEYRLDVSQTPVQWLAKLVSGDVIKYRVTVVEGSTVAEMLALLHSHPEVKPVQPALTVENLGERLELPHMQHPEGWFFPDTYVFRKGATDLAIFGQAHRRMMTVLQQEWDARAAELPYRNRYEALIMASIVERESGHDDERGQITGVFMRRLKKGMRLQTDPTVIYGMGEAYDGNLRRRDLRRDTPYNTYLRKGLPPTPIALPGRAAIRAALNPAAGDALYFVARGDGSHFFSNNLADHRRAVQKYQVDRRAKNYRSAPKK